MNTRHCSIGSLGLLLACVVLPVRAELQIAEINSAAIPTEAELSAGKPATTASLPAGLQRLPDAPLGMGYASEVEPNGTPATASPLTGTSAVVRASVYPNADEDYYSFTATAGDRLYAAVTTSTSSNASTDSQLYLYQADGTTQIEFDENDGTFGASSSTIAGATLTAGGTYYLRVKHNSATGQLRPYDLFVRLQSGAPTAEVEANDSTATATALPASGWANGTHGTPTDVDFFSFTANAGDTVFLSLDLDPERDNVQWNGRLGLALFGDAADQILVINDASTGSAANPLSEAMVLTVKDAGTYYAYVDSTVATGDGTHTYQLSMTKLAEADEGVNCTTYTSTNVPQTIGPGAGLVSSTITVPGNPRIADIDVNIVLNHTIMNQIDAHLRSPAGNDNGIFSDIGASVAGGQAQMDAWFDDEAAIPPAYTVLKGLRLKPELAYRMSWFDGEDAGGTWTLDLRDDIADANGGTLTGWSLRICEAAPAPTCAPGFAATTVYTTDFESGAAGFTHSGTADEWELGLPATPASGASSGSAVAAFNSCNSGVNCWKTDLDNTYNNAVAVPPNVTQDLLSPNINLTGLTAPVVVTWAQRHQIESASFDHAYIDYRQVGGATPVRLFEWMDATPSEGVGNPAVNLGESSGWSVFSRRADSLAGLNTELLFHVDQDDSVALAGLAIDDVTVTACRALSADLSITKTDGAATEVPGTTVTYTIVASNAGPDPVTGATVTDTFPATLSACTWTCVGAGTGTCTAGGAGNINDVAVNLAAGDSVTYTATCTIAAAATGTIVNTATVSSAITDPDPVNNSATDTDTLTPQADLIITKSDGVGTVLNGGVLTYTIVASNAGPSDAPGTQVTDTFPAALTCSWTCMVSVGGTCGAGGPGNIADTANIPAGGNATYTATCTVTGGAPGMLLSNTATVANAGVTDPDGANNAATDTTTVLAPAAVTGTKTVSGSFLVGGNITYTVVLSNTGGVNQADNPGDEFTDTLSAMLTSVAASATSGTATVVGNTVTWNGAIPAGGSVTITINATILASASGIISNQGTIAFDADGNGGNESTALTDDPATGAAADPTNFGVNVPPTPVPALNWIGLALLALLLGGFAMRRRIA
ncbi:MAG: DUF11 domain-containing protein [Xanthomonadales bacterium]|nr:DUF11 domain-containing protein [Xanthomonadales bacterium]